MTADRKITYTTILDDEEIHRNYDAAMADVAEELGKEHPLFIGGKKRLADREFGTRSPIDRDIVIGTFQNGGSNEIEMAIATARREFPGWEATDWRDRTRMIRSAADLLEGRVFRLAALITCETGKNRYEAIAEVTESIDLIRYYAGIYEQNQGYRTRMGTDEPGGGSESILRPFGVWAVISPFNFPLALAAGMITAALVTGNTVVFKPTSETPLSGLRLYEALVEGGIPPGVLNFVTGPGEFFGEVVTSHPDVAGIAFTGSRDAGMWLQRNLALRQAWPKPLVAEMGSKNPAIITARADLGKAVEGVTRAAFGFGGQKCSATSRVYVHSTVARQFIDRLKERVEKIAVGDPRIKETFLGPLMTEKALNTFLNAVVESQRDGGILVTGGTVIPGRAYERGYYVSPAIVSGLPRNHRLWKDELFCPFLLVDTFETLEEALDMANNTEYGLTSGIFSEDAHEIDYFFEHIRFGVSYANREGGATTGSWPGVQSFTGWKGSGSTGRGAGGPYYLLSFVREQARTR